ncbi:MAG: hypothetical protein NC210_02750 [[Clostridium] fimetarium]|nr:hypothetical protein [Alistipes timonensis]MCM1405322.1 hypothetical protein [[Clostridium] fimetarium]
MIRFTLMVAVSALLALGVASCGESEKQKREETTARVLGRAQALELSADLPLDSMEMEKQLIDVRSRESELRRRGHDRVADIYLEAFLSTLDSVNPALAAEIR